MNIIRGCIEQSHIILVEIELSPQASWDQYGITVAGLSNVTNNSSSTALNIPFDISITNNDVLYISDSYNHRIVLVDFTANSTVSFIGSGPGPGQGQFSQPMGLSLTNTSLFVIDLSNTRVQKSSLNGSDSSTVVDLSGIGNTFYLYVDDSDNIYVSDALNHRVLLYLPNSTNGTMVAGNGSAGSNYSQLWRPYGIFVNRNRTLYIADRGNNRIMKWFTGATVGVLAAGNGVAGNGSIQLDTPSQVLVDTNGYMYITEVLISRVTRWTPHAIFGECIAACTGVRGTAATQLDRPHSLAFDSHGSLYVNDRSNNRIQKFQILSNHRTYQIRSPLIRRVSRCRRESVVSNLRLEFNFQVLHVWSFDSTVICS